MRKLSKDNLTSYKEIKDKIWLNRKFSMYTLRNVIMNIREKTSESFIKNHTNKGWEYAFANKNEIIDLIYNSTFAHKT